MRKLTLATLALVAASPATGADLASTAARLATEPAWKAEFAQHYLPAGFQTATEEHGTLLLSPPDKLVFTYPQRVFAVDGVIARLVDRASETCDAVRLDDSTWGRLPLSALLDPGAAERYFLQQTSEERIILMPREPNPDLARIEIRTFDTGLPREVTIEDEAGNRNTFAFSNWTPAPQPPPSTFAPGLAGLPCRPTDG